MSKNKKQKLNFAKNLLFDAKLVYLRSEEKSFEEPNTIESGRAAAESLKYNFERRYSPEVFDNVDNTIHGVRTDLMEGPLGNLNLLSGGAIITHRVRYWAEHFYRQAPKILTHLFDEERTRRGFPKEKRLDENALKKINEEIAKEFFTYDMSKGQSYISLVRGVQSQVNGIGHIGGIGFTDSNGQLIDLTLSDATNEFDVAAGASRTYANDRIVIRWHSDEEDYDSIRRKLEDAGIWNDFLKQGGGMKWKVLQLRLSKLKQVVAEEKAKLSNEKFNPERLERWLNTEGSLASMGDDQYRNWVNTTMQTEITNEQTRRGLPVLPITTQEELQDQCPDTYQEMLNQREAAKKRVHETTVRGTLERILIPKTLEDVSGSTETRTMLAYLYHKMQDSRDNNRVRQYLEELAGNYDLVTESISGISDSLEKFKNIITEHLNKYREVRDKIEDNESRISTPTVGTTPASGIDPTLTTLDGEYRGIEATLRTLTSPADIRTATARMKEINKRRDSLQKEKREIQQENRRLQGDIRASEKVIINTTTSFCTLMDNNKTNDLIWPGGLQSMFQDAPNELTLFEDLVNRFKDLRGRSTDVYIDRLSRFVSEEQTIGGVTFMPFLLDNAVDKISKSLEASEQSYRDKQEKAEGVEKMDARGLLYKLIERDLRGRGLRVQKGLETQGVFLTNDLIAQCRNYDIFGDTNQHIVNGIMKTGWRRRMERIKTGFEYSDLKNGEYVLQHITKTDPDLAMLRDITMLDTRKDMVEKMNRYGFCTPAKLREFSKKIGEFIKGIKVEKKPTLKEKIKAWRKGESTPSFDLVSVKDEDVPYLERMVHNLTLIESQLSTVNFLEQLETEEGADYDKPRSEIMLAMLKEETVDSKELDDELAESIEPHGAIFKKLMIRKNLSQAFNGILDENEGFDKEYIDEQLEKEGIHRDLAKRGAVSVRTARALKRAGMYAFWPPKWWKVTAYPSALGYGVGWLLGKSGLGVGKYFKGKGKAFWGEFQEGRQSAKDYMHGRIYRIPLHAASVVGGIGAWGLALPERILGGVAAPIKRAAGRKKAA